MKLHEISPLIRTPNRIFAITTMGMFSIWDLRTFELIYTREFYKRAKMIYSFKLSNKVMLVFENEIIVLDSDPEENKFEELPRYNLKLNTLSDCKINNNEKFLGVATISAATPEVSLYDTEDGFTLLKTLYGFKASIRYIDFSTDNYYLQCEDNLGEIMLFEIETQRVVHTDAIDFELEWTGEGLKNSSSALKGVHYFYDKNNKITEIAKVIGLPVVAIGDDIGTIRLYSYPNKTGEPYYQCYADHLYSVSNCLFSPNRKLLLSASEYDRCIFKWKVNYRKDIIEKYENPEIE
jgi:WD40 repeat protein